MTYKLDPILEKIESPVAIIMPDNKTIEYENGVQACADSFEIKLGIKRITAENGRIVIELEEISSRGDSAMFDGE